MAERPGGESQSSDLDNVFIRLPNGGITTYAKRLELQHTNKEARMSTAPLGNMLGRFIPRRKQ